MLLRSTQLTLLQNHHFSIEHHGSVISYKHAPSYLKPRHQHHGIQLLIPLEGAHFDIEWTDEGGSVESKPLGAADICIIPSGIAHEVRWSYRAHFVSVFFCPVYLMSLPPHSLEVKSLDIPIKIGVSDMFIYYLASAIVSFFMHYESKNPTDAEAYIRVLGHHFLTQYTDWPIKKNLKSFVPCTKMRDAVLYFKQHINRIDPLTEIASFLDISPYYFTRIFKKEGRMPPSKFHMMLRIDAAKKRLLEGNSITDVTCEFGFSSQSHFSHMFKKETGMTP